MRLMRRAILGVVASLALSTVASATVISAVGKDTSVYFDDLGGTSQTVVSGDVVASVGLPAHYNSKEHFLIIRTTVSETCPAAFIASTVTVGGLSTTNGMTFTDCDSSNGGFAVFTRTWQLVPEKAGGPAVPAGATVELRLFSGGLNPPNARRGFVNVQVESAK